MSITSTAALDGLVLSSGATMAGSNITAGDYADAMGPQAGTRGFVSFDISAIPLGATVLSATMTLTQRLVEAAPYATLGSIFVDQVVYGNVLEGGAYSRPFPDFQGFATLSGDATLGPKTVIVTSQVQADLASQRPQSQFRFRFAVEEDGDGDSDQAAFWSADTAQAPADLPTLVVTYQR